MNRRYLLIYISIILVCTKCGSRKTKSDINEKKESNSGYYIQAPHVWKAFGPFGSPHALAELNAISPHGAGRFMCSNVHPKNSDEILIGHATSGIFKTTDGGKTWVQKLQLELATGIFKIIRFNQNPKHLMASSAMDIGNSKQYGYGIFESLDGGETWQRNSLQFHPEEYNLDQCRDLAIIDSKKELRLLSISSHDIYTSTDGGISWSKSFQSPYNLKSIVVDPDNENNILVCGNGLLNSTDGGRTWNDITDLVNTSSGTGKSVFSRMHAGFSQRSPGSIFIVNENQNVFLLELLPGAERICNLIHRNICPINLSRLSFLIQFDKKTKEETFWIGCTNMFKSSDQGKHFEQCSRPILGALDFTHDDINEIQLDEKNNLYIATDGGVDISTDGALHWNSLTNTGNGLNASLLFGFDRSEKGILMCGTQDNGIFSYREGTWYCSSQYGDGGRAVAIDDSASFACGFAQMNFITKDAGKRFNYLHAGNERTRFDFRIQFVKKSKSLYLANMHLYQKKESKYFELLSSGSNADRKIKAFYVDPENEQNIWICRDDATWGSKPKNKLLKSIDGGANWIDLSENIPILAWRSICDIYVNSNGTVAIALEAFDKKDGMLQKVYFSEDGGQSFDNVSYGLPNLPVNTILFAHGNWICGTNDGVYTMEKRAWTRLGSDFPYCIVSELRYFESDKMLMASTFGRGIWGMRLE